MNISRIGIDLAKNVFQLHGVWTDLVALDDRLSELDRDIQKLANNNEVTQRL